MVNFNRINIKSFLHLASEFFIYSIIFYFIKDLHIDIYNKLYICITALILIHLLFNKYNYGSVLNILEVLQLKATKLTVVYVDKNEESKMVHIQTHKTDEESIENEVEKIDPNFDYLEYVFIGHVESI